MVSGLTTIPSRVIFCIANIHNIEKIGVHHSEDQSRLGEVSLVPEGKKINLAGQFYERITDEVGSPITATYRLFSNENSSAFGETYTKTIVDVYDPKDRDRGIDTVLLMTEAEADALYDIQKANMPYSHETESKYKEKEGSVFSSVFLSYDHSEAATDQILALYQARETFSETDWTRLSPRSSVTDGFDSVDSMVSELKQVFL